MLKYAITNADGTVQALGANRTLPEGAIAVTGELESYAAMMFVNGFWMQRPAVPDPVVIGKMIRFEGVPDGGFCTILDRDYNYVAATITAESGVIEFQISDAGAYQLEVSLPLPWLSKTLNVVIE